MQQIQPIDPDEQQPVWDYTIRLGQSGQSFDQGSQEPPPPIEFRLRLTYRERQDSWYIDVFELVADVLPGFDGAVELDEDRPIITGLRLPAGMLSPMINYQIPELGGPQFFFILDVDASNSDPGFEALGRSHALMHADLRSLITNAAELASELGIVDQVNIEFGEEEPDSIVILP